MKTEIQPYTDIAYEATWYCPACGRCNLLFRVVLAEEILTCECGQQVQEWPDEEDGE